MFIAERWPLYPFLLGTVAARGNPICFDRDFTFERCCMEGDPACLPTEEARSYCCEPDTPLPGFEVARQPAPTCFNRLTMRGGAPMLTWKLCCRGEAPPECAAVLDCCERSPLLFPDSNEGQRSEVFQLYLPYHTLHCLPWKLQALPSLPVGAKMPTNKQDK